MRCLCRHWKGEHRLKKEGTKGGCSVKKCWCKQYECGHWRIKKNYPFGRKSKPMVYCKDCGCVVKPKDLKEKRIRTKKTKRR